MPYIVTIPEIEKDETIVFPISMNQPLQREERLEAILNSFKIRGYQDQITLLLCDYLNRHNCGSEEKAFHLGDVFLYEHASILKGFKIVRWKDYIDSHEPTFSMQHVKMQKLAKEDALFSWKINKTWNKCLKSSQSLEASMDYQIEEYAALLCMGEFDHLYYPQKITDGIAFTYKLAHQLKIKVPFYNALRITQIKNEEKSSSNLFLGDKVTSDQHLHIAFRGLLAHLNMLLTSKELSDNAKQRFVNASQNVFMSLGFEIDAYHSNEEENNP